MTAAILLWFYKDPRCVLNRIHLIRLFDPGIKIFGLYGGPPADLKKFRRALELCDDCWSHPVVSGSWAWFNGDKMLANWFIERGRFLSWEQIFVYQWDLVIAKSVKDLLLRHDKQVLLTGVRSLKEVQSSWVWVQSWSDHFKAFEDFKNDPELAGATLWASIFIFGVFPRRFFDRASELIVRMPGFIEYRLPTLAQHLGFEFMASPIMPDWGDCGDAWLNGYQKEVSSSEMFKLMRASEQARIFHPVLQCCARRTVLDSLNKAEVLAL